MLGRPREEHAGCQQEQLPCARSDAVVGYRSWFRDFIAGPPRPLFPPCCLFVAGLWGSKTPLCDARHASVSGSRSPATPTLATVGPQVQTASAGSNAERASTHTGPPGHAARTKATTAPDRAAARGDLTGTTPCPRTGLVACRAKIVERAWGARSSGPKGKSSAGFARVPMELHAWSQQDDLPTTARNRLHPVSGVSGGGFLVESACF